MPHTAAHQHAVQIYSTSLDDIEPDDGRPRVYRVWIRASGSARASASYERAWPVDEFYGSRLEGSAWHDNVENALAQQEALGVEFRDKSLEPEVRSERARHCPYCQALIPVYGTTHAISFRPGTRTKPTTACTECFAREFPE